MSVAALIRDMIAEGATPQLILIAVRSLEAVPAQRVKGTVKRKGSKWRAKQFSDLCKMHGPYCQKCDQAHKIVWRAAGVYVTNFIEEHRYTKVNPCSILEVDHKIPLSDGGTNDIDNLWLLCRDCHKKKTIAERTAVSRSSFEIWPDGLAA